MRSWWWCLNYKKNGSHFKFVLFFLIIYFILSGTFIYIKSSNEFSKKRNSDVCIHGLLYEARLVKKDKIKYLDSAEIEIFDTTNPKPIYKFNTNKAGAFFAKIPLNNKFKIKLFKKGWYARQLQINTMVPELYLKEFHLFIDAELFKEINDLSIKEIDFPTIEIYFDTDEKRFVSILNQSKHFNKNFRRLYLTKINSAD